MTVRLAMAALACAGGMCAAAVHPWEKQELTFTAAQSYANPYVDVTVWVDLQGPHFHQRVYGFWDGGATFRVRLVATEPGVWRWRSGSTPPDAGLSGKSGSFAAVPWSEEELRHNPLRHGFLRATPNGHALEQADGTPFFALGDTWWALGTNRFRWYDDDRARPLGPEAGFKDYVRYRKQQGYNWVNMIAAFPNWMTDGQPWHVVMNDAAKTTVRSAWLEFGTGSAKNMDNEGGRPFLFPGKVPGYENMFPDVDRVNPGYFRYIDRKIDYLNTQGFVPFIEVSRRDASLLWSKYYAWPESYARFIEYVWSRYQANHTVLSPIHLDIISETVGPEEYLKAIRMVREKYGMPPFGTLLSANANPSTLENWGDHSWVTLAQIGNMREHNNYWYLTEIFRAPHPHPALNGEPYYAGYTDARSLGGGRGYQYGAKGGTGQDDQYVRSAMYGSFLSGGLAGHVYGAEGIWGADIEDAAPIKMWDAFEWRSGGQMRYLREFAFSAGKRYQDLEPDADLVSPDKTHVLRGYEGWAYCARTPDRAIFLAYFEKGCPRSQVRGAALNAAYRAEWFDPRNGTWLQAGNGVLRSNQIGTIMLPDFPADNDWGVRLMLQTGGQQPAAAAAASAGTGSKALLYVDNSLGDDLTVIDLGSLKVVDTIRVGDQPHGLCAPASGRRLFVTIESEKSLKTIETTTGRILDTIPLDGRPNECAATPDGRYVGVPLRNADRVDIIDTSLRKVVKALPVKAPHNCFNAGSNDVIYVSSMGSHEIEAIDLRKMAYSAKIPVGGIPRPYAVSPDETTLYSALTNLHGFVIAGIPNRKVIARVELPPAPPLNCPLEMNTPTHGLALTPDGKQLWITSLADGGVYVYDVATKKISPMIHVGQCPNWIAFSPDGKYCAVSNSDSNDCSIIDTQTQREVARIKTGKGPKRVLVVNVPVD